MSCCDGLWCVALWCGVLCGVEVYRVGSGAAPFRFVQFVLWWVVCSGVELFCGGDVMCSAVM